MLPAWVARLPERFGLGNIAALQQKSTAGASQGGQQIATRAFDIGQNTLDVVIGFFVSLYLAYFLRRDGASLRHLMGTAIPLDPQAKCNFFRTFATVIRATVKGNILVAALQGVLGAIAFWYLDIQGAVLWGVLMAFLSLPAIGAALVWLPAAIVLLAWQPGLKQDAAGDRLQRLVGDHPKALARSHTGQPEPSACNRDLGARARPVAIRRGDLEPARVGEVDAVTHSRGPCEMKLEFDLVRRPWPAPRCRCRSRGSAARAGRRCRRRSTRWAGHHRQHLRSGPMPGAAAPASAAAAA